MNKSRRKYTASKQLAKALRQRMTPTEREAWSILRRIADLPSRFRRQSPIGPYIVDFVCNGLKLIVEIDGGAHGIPGVAERDKVREARLVWWGYTVLRVTDREAINAAVLGAKVRAAALRIMTPL
jgi:very-short-patch-repair endonuclease